jgi:hypothetical protein
MSVAPRAADTENPRLMIALIAHEGCGGVGLVRVRIWHIKILYIRLLGRLLKRAREILGKF